MGTECVLLVQPHPDSRDMYAEFLSHRGVRTVAVGDGEHALLLAKDAGVLITALHMPGLDGIELIARLRTDERTRHLPVIVLTSCASSDERMRAERAGCDAILQIPCLPDELLNAIRRVSVKSARGPVIVPEKQSVTRQHRSQ